MPHAFIRIAALGLLLPAALVAGGWEQLKPGMSRDEASMAVGFALITSVGRGFEVAVYDERAELVYLDGRLVAWTAPASRPVPPAPLSTWQFNQVRTQPLPAPKVPPALARPPVQRGAILPAYRL
jgi:hypothetical protein